MGLKGGPGKDALCMSAKSFVHNVKANDEARYKIR